MRQLFTTLLILALIVANCCKQVSRRKIKEIGQNHLPSPSPLVVQNDDYSSEEEEEEDEDSEVSAKPQNCMRDGWYPGVCVPNYLCKTQSTDSDEYDSDEYEKPIVNKSPFPKFCSSYLETCCPRHHILENSENFKENDQNAIFEH